MREVELDDLRDALELLRAGRGPLFEIVASTIHEVHETNEEMRADGEQEFPFGADGTGRS